jgi:hypothetical protein
MRTIAVVTGTRAEYGYLKPLMQAIERDRELTLVPLITGMHLLPQFGNTSLLVKKDFPTAKPIFMTYKGDQLKHMAEYLASGINHFTSFFDKNRPDILDPALLRPGRFDRRVVLDRPDVTGRTAILKVHAKGKPLEPNINLEILAKQTAGFSGADLANLMNEAAILAARRNKKTVGMAEMEEAIDRLIAGPEKKSRVISQKERELAAYHEAGHALVAKSLPNADPVHKISIVARGMMGGYTRLLPTEDRTHNFIVNPRNLYDCR